MYLIGGLKSSMTLLQWGLGLLLPALIGALLWMANSNSGRFDRLNDRVHDINRETAKHGADISALQAERHARTPARSGGR